MAVLMVILYPDPKTADEVLETVERLMREGHLDLEDACAVVKDEKGKVELHQENNLSVFGAIAGLALGTFLGWFIWLPYLGVPGAILGAMMGRVSDRGIDDNYMNDISKEMYPQTSALFLSLRNSTVDHVIQALAPYGGRIFHTSLEKAEELALEEKLAKLRNQQPPPVDRTPELHD